MITALILASVLTGQTGQDFWVVTEANEREVTAINVGFAFVPEDRDDILASVATVHRLGTEATGWGRPAYTSENIAFRCTDQTYLVRFSTTSSGSRDPTRTETPDGVFVGVATDPQRQRQAEAVCRPRSDDAEGFADLYALQRAHGALRQAEVTPPLPGPQPYPMTAADRRRDAERRQLDDASNASRPPRIGIDASRDNNPGGSLIIGYSEGAIGRWITEFFSMVPWWMDTAAEPVIFVRRALDSYEAQEQIRWVDGRTCPGLVEAMLPANGLALPPVILPLDQASRERRLAEGPPYPPPPHGSGPHIFWATTPGVMGMSIQFSADGGPWVEWSRSVERALEPCWQDERPVMPVRD